MKNITIKPKPDKIQAYHWGSKEYYYSRKVNITCQTDGSSLWSNSKRKIIHNKIELMNNINNWWDNYDQYSSLRVYFNKKYWDVEKHGLIYTDELWMKSFLKEMNIIGFKNLKKIQYSEQGRQGNNYVDLDVDEKFKNEFFNILYTEKEKLLGSFAEI